MKPFTPTATPLALMTTLAAALLFAAGCANENAPYTEQAAEIDPAMNTPDKQTPSPSSPPAGSDATALNAGLDTPGKVELTDDQWRSILSQEEFYILRRAGTERPGTGRYNEHPKDKKGAFHCVGCGNKLYDARHKFHSGCGWPSFNQAVEPGAMTFHTDNTLGMTRTEMRCARCDGHLGHVFDDGHLWNQDTGKRHCVNGNVIIFVPEGEDVKDVIRAHREQFAGR